MNVALRLVAFGAGGRLLTRVGDDADGRLLLAFMQQHGLDTRYVQVDASQPTGHVDVDTSDASAARYDIAMPVAWDFIDADEYLARSGGRIDVLVYGSLGARHAVSRASQLRLIGEARLRVFDVNLRPPHDDWDTVRQLLAGANWVKLNDTELRQVAERSGAPAEPEAAARWLCDEFGLDLVCVTLGAAGAILLVGERLYRQPAFEVDVVDTIGCGDAFLGTLLSELLRKREPQAALERACAAGAIVAQHAGGNPDLTEAQIQALLSGRSG